MSKDLVHYDMYVCAVKYSSLIHIYYSEKKSRPINPDEEVFVNDLSVPPKVELDLDYLSKQHSNGYVSSSD